MAGHISQQLEDLLNPLPKFTDPEDDHDEGILHCLSCLTGTFGFRFEDNVSVFMYKVITHTPGRRVATACKARQLASKLAHGNHQFTKNLSIACSDDHHVNW